MIKEERHEPRVPCQRDLTLAVGDDSFGGHFVDLSLGGALLEVSPNFENRIKPGSVPSILCGQLRIPARVCRIGVYDDKLYIGIVWTASPKNIEDILVDERQSEVLYESDLPAPERRAIESTVLDVSKEIKLYLAKHPKRLYDLTPRQFEKLIASILEDFGLDVELTRSSRDGGVDIYAYIRNQIASFLILVECKRWAPNRRVGLDVVQRLYGIQQIKGANKSLVVTTSYFTASAKEECRQYYPLMELKDYEQVKAWLQYCAR